MHWAPHPHFDDVTSRTTKVSHIQGPNLPQLFSSEPSEQSFSPLQNKPLSIQFPSPQARKPSWQRGSSVNRRGFTLRSLFFNLQFLTESFQSHVCLSMSKYKPAGQRIAWSPYNKLHSLLWRNRLNFDLFSLPKMCTGLRHDSYLLLPPPTGTIHQHLYLYKVQLQSSLLFSAPSLPAVLLWVIELKSIVVARKQAILYGTEKVSDLKMSTFHIHQVLNMLSNSTVEIAFMIIYTQLPKYPHCVTQLTAFHTRMKS